MSLKLRATISFLLLATTTLAQPPAPPKPTAPDIVQLLAEPYRAADAARKLIADYPPAEAIPALLAAIKGDPIFAVGKQGRIAAYTALARIDEVKMGTPRLRDAGQIEQLVIGLTDPNEQVRSVSARSLGFVTAERRASMKQPLAGVLADPSLLVIASALDGLRVLGLKESVPPEVWALAVAPPNELKDKITKGQSPLVSQSAVVDGEVQLRIGAMAVVTAWEGLARLYAPDVQLDAAGTRARAVAATFALATRGGRVDLPDDARATMLNEMVAFFKDSPGLTGVEKSIIGGLIAAANAGDSKANQDAAMAALQQCAEVPNESKRAFVKQMLASLPQR